MKVFLSLILAAGIGLGMNLPEAAFDLRNVSGKNFVSAVKSQSGGTCWTHATMAAVEGNLLLTGEWLDSGESGESNLAEYHLDWWNGFNEHHNADVTESHGLTVHEGGDYRVAAAYLSRGGGPVRDKDAQSYTNPPKQDASTFKYFYARDIEWFSVGPNLENISKVKEAIKQHGVIGTALAWDDAFYSNGTFYQPTSSTVAPNHAVAIVGWDDAKVTQAPKPGAWLAKNSWGTSWGSKGYFWISYYDKVTAKHPEMGAVSFRGVEVLPYDNIYTHDYHGWRDTRKDVSRAFNAFTADGGRNPKAKEVVEAVAFYTSTPQVEYRLSIYKKFEGGALSQPVSVQEGYSENTGYHTVDLNYPVFLTAGEKFYVEVEFSKGGHAYDRTSDVPVLLGGGSRTIVKSSASAGESFYLKNGKWNDLTKDDASANFCIKALSTFR